MKFHELLSCLLVCCVGILNSKKIDYTDFIFVILSQHDPIHEKRALALEFDLLAQTNNKSTVYVTHRDLKHVGAWTVLPILKRLWDLQEGTFDWMFFFTDQTKNDVKNLVSALENYDPDESHFIGKGLEDLERTIIHHFALLPDFKYPLFAAGFGFNHKLMERLINSMTEKNSVKVDFSIDASHELALFIKNNLNGTLLKTSPHFCMKNKEDCATHVSNEYFCKEMDIRNIFFAVKTCKKFHKDRVPIVKATWGKNAHHIAFFSEAYDKNIPTVKLNISNTKSGHCGKTKAIFSIMKTYLTDNVDLKWVILTDDDTILSVRRIQKLVSCYDSDVPYVLGERYGYNVYSEDGYNYITGGGGAALSRAAVFKIAEDSCTCPSDSTPDDMYLLGVCLKRLKIILVHIPLFHQARPDDYSPEYLEIGDPISFHKHWMTDPIQIYENWFSEFDSHNSELHTEL